MFAFREGVLSNYLNSKKQLEEVRQDVELPNYKNNG